MKYRQISHAIKTQGPWASWGGEKKICTLSVCPFLSVYISLCIFLSECLSLFCCISISLSVFVVIASLLWTLFSYFYHPRICLSVCDFSNMYIVHNNIYQKMKSFVKFIFWEIFLFSIQVWREREREREREDNIEGKYLLVLIYSKISKRISILLKITGLLKSP